MPREAHLVDTGSDLAPQNEGWFVVNLADAAWELNDRLGAMCAFEGQRAPFAQVGVNVRVLWPGRTGGLYHAESAQEGALGRPVPAPGRGARAHAGCLGLRPLPARHVTRLPRRR